MLINRPPFALQKLLRERFAQGVALHIGQGECWQDFRLDGRGPLRGVLPSVDNDFAAAFRQVEGVVDLFVVGLQLSYRSDNGGVDLVPNQLLDEAWRLVLLSRLSSLGGIAAGDVPVRGDPAPYALGFV